MSSSEVIIKKRSRPTTNRREHSNTPEPTTASSIPPTQADETIVDAQATPLEVQDEDANLPLDELREILRLRRARQGIDVGKLNQGEKKKRKGAGAEGDGSTTTPTGLIKGSPSHKEDGDQDKDKDRPRRTIRSNNFTQQTNALDVDKHMMAYIEEHMKLRRAQDGSTDDSKMNPSKPLDPQDEFVRLMEQYKNQSGKKLEEGNVTNSLAMLTAIPEVDLGMDARLRNIEETERAKRTAAEQRRERRNEDEERLASTRFYKPNLRQKSDADIIRDAKLEAMGLRPEDYESRKTHHHDRPQTATDEMVMERFKKRMRK